MTIHFTTNQGNTTTEVPEDLGTVKGIVSKGYIAEFSRILPNLPSLSTLNRA